IYYDEHERNDILQYQKEFLEKIYEHEEYMSKYEDEFMNQICLSLSEGEKERVLVVHDEYIFYLNDGKCGINLSDVKSVGKSISELRINYSDNWKIKDMRWVGQGVDNDETMAGLFLSIYVTARHMGWPADRPAARLRACPALACPSDTGASIDHIHHSTCGGSWIDLILLGHTRLSVQDVKFLDLCLS
ncbi:12206_t:CDS:2, partial [Ambispora leptoticha]